MQAMIISYLGKEFFKLSHGDTVFAFNPVNKNSKHKELVARFGADVVFVTANHSDFNGADMLSHGDKSPFVVSGPGDYEVKGIFAKGVESEANIDNKKLVNSIYFIEFEDIKICFLGALATAKISQDVLEEISHPDILFVPIGGHGVLSPSEAYKFSVSLEPKIIIPMDYGSDKVKDALKIFLKEGGAEKVEALDKLTVKKKDLEGREGDVVVLKH
jgi:L-ascorbate metabolism protein UlaG (beta-lactamase superfamily)